MTTIAFTDGVMAADTQETVGDALKLRGKKLARLPCGGVAGIAGNSDDCQRALNWLQNPKGKPPKITDCWVLIAYGDGRVGMVVDRKWTFIPHTPPVAIGSGSPAAMAAMVYFNASALDAVQAAAVVDPNTSGPFDVMQVTPSKAKRRKQGK